jgi:hypothetical protein
MQRFLKTTFWAAISFIAIILATTGLLHILPIEFATSAYQNVFDYLLFLGLPIAIILMLTGTIKRTERTGAIILKILLTLFIAFFSMVFSFVSVFFDFCSWSTSKILFEKNDASAQIVSREFDCGALDSSSPDYKVVIIKHLTPVFIYITDVDTTKINRTVWKRVNY